ARRACSPPWHAQHGRSIGRARCRWSGSWAAASAAATAASSRCAATMAHSTTCDRASPDRCSPLIGSGGTDGAWFLVLGSWSVLGPWSVVRPWSLVLGWTSVQGPRPDHALSVQGPSTDQEPRTKPQEPMDLTTRLGPLVLKNPIVAASGCFGYGVEYADVVDLSSLGAIVVKGLFLAERDGHPAPRIVETPAGMLNALGLQGIGVRRFVAEKLPELRARNATVIVNVCGTTLDEYVEVSRILSDADGVAAIELNISCPNIKEGGIQFGCSLNGTFDVVSAVRKVT